MFGKLSDEEQVERNFDTFRRGFKCRKWAKDTKNKREQ